MMLNSLHGFYMPPPPLYCLLVVLSNVKKRFCNVFGSVYLYIRYIPFYVLTQTRLIPSDFACKVEFNCDFLHDIFVNLLSVLEDICSSINTRFLWASYLIRVVVNRCKKTIRMAEMVT
ncbi:hypothetical protein L6452_39679 [Arctium lappa]|uniref:Uncharacterized protein n=1 Tax=Arctium lappa TaxID=4217 RepID=A0ACB8XTN6_ARCLA|nr:hypothetical protein L6452_39679 [Arctium lappa]